MDVRLTFVNRYNEALFVRHFPPFRNVLDRSPLRINAFFSQTHFRVCVRVYLVKSIPDLQYFLWHMLLILSDFALQMSVQLRSSSTPHCRPYTDL